MISVKYTILLVALAFGSVPEIWAAPVGTRSVNVKTMRRMEMEREHMRRSHHSAVDGALIKRDPVSTTTDSSTATPTPVVVAREPNAPVDVAERHEPHVTETPAPIKPGKMMRRHHSKNNGAAPTPRALPRFKRDEQAKKERSPELVERKTDASDANVARNVTEDAPPPRLWKRVETTTTATSTVPTPAGAGGKAKREPEPAPTSVFPTVTPTPTPESKLKEKREPAPEPEPSIRMTSAYPVPTPETKDKREPANEKRAEEPPAPTTTAVAYRPLRPVRLVRRAMALDDLD